MNVFLKQEVANYLHFSFLKLHRIRINLPLFSTVVPAIIFVFLSCRPCYNNIINRSCGCWSDFLVFIELFYKNWNKIANEQQRDLEEGCTCNKWGFGPQWCPYQSKEVMCKHAMEMELPLWGKGLVDSMCLHMTLIHKGIREIGTSNFLCVCKLFDVSLTFCENSLLFISRSLFISYSYCCDVHISVLYFST